ncbi:MAG: hypothetical protein GXO33_06310 [Epsilonproteobacteria bacterium]|nr:hypothetical protein [Campylobacterota bacterium]
MHQLEAFYELAPRPVGFVERKYEIPSYSLNLHGPPLCGKTWLALDHLQRLPGRRSLYIDLSDPRIDEKSLYANLQDFIDTHGIETVILDHCLDTPPFLPKCRQVLLLSQQPLEGFPLLPKLPVSPLDFEEFLAFETRHLQPQHSFSLYLKTGRLPHMAKTAESLITLRLHETVRRLFPDPLERQLFKVLAAFNGKSVTPHHIYTLLKRDHALSKDRLYATLKRWEMRGILQWVAKTDRPKAARRLLLFDFALPASMYFEKSLMGQLYTIAAQRLHHLTPEMTWSDGIDLFDPLERHAYLLSPFANPEGTAQKIAKAGSELDRLKARKITVLTIANTFEFRFDHIRVQAKPFYEWVVEE